jgi:hypothetical protein
MDSVIEHLKTILPPISQVAPGLKKKTKKELCGPCPFPSCDADHDGFVVFLDSGRYLCRKCTPKGGDVVDFHCRSEGTDINGLMEKYLGSQSAPDHKHPVNPKVVDRYDYKDEKGYTLYWKERVEPGREGRDKDFFFYHYGPKGKEKGRGHDQVLYKLPNVIKEKSVIICEGEKHCDFLATWGLTATSLDSGAQSKLTADMINQLSGKRVVILRDNDAPGIAYAHNLACALYGKCNSLKVILLPGLPEKGDILDWVQKPGNEKGHLLRLSKN